MTEDSENNPRKLLRIDLNAGTEIPFSIQPDAAARAAIAHDLKIDAVRKLRFEGRVMPQGQSDWALEGRLGATVVQPCVVTLAPVTTRIEEPVSRVFLADPPLEPEGGETEMPEDDRTEALGEEIDLWNVMVEALALALPVYPRADGAALEEAAFSEPGVAPLTDDDVKPFAGLKALRDRMSDPGDGDD